MVIQLVADGDTILILIHLGRVVEVRQSGKKACHLVRDIVTSIAQNFLDPVCDDRDER